MKNIYYQTRWQQGKKQGVYTTKSLTDFHKRIHAAPQTDYAITLQVDTKIPFPIGVFSEVLAITSKKNPSKNKPFES